MENDLLNLPGWKRCKRYASKKNIFKPDPRQFQANLRYVRRKIYKAKLKSYKTSTKYKYGFEIPTSYKEAERLDGDNKNNRWTVSYTHLTLPTT